MGEMKAVSERGGFVVHGRVMGMIAIARALGDKSLADYLGHEPDVFARELDNIDLLFLHVMAFGMFCQMKKRFALLVRRAIRAKWRSVCVTPQLIVKVATMSVFCALRPRTRVAPTTIKTIVQKFQ